MNKPASEQENVMPSAMTFTEDDLRAALHDVLGDLPASTFCHDPTFNTAWMEPDRFGEWFSRDDIESVPDRLIALLRDMQESSEQRERTVNTKVRINLFCRLAWVACRVPDPLSTWVLRLANHILEPVTK